MLTAMLLAAALAQASAPPPPITPPPAVSQAPAPPAANPGDWRPLDPADTLVIDTTKGRIVVELHPELAPRHVARIKTLTRRGYYDGSLFYRVLPFMAQTGDKGAKRFRSPLPNLKNEIEFTLTPAIPYTSFGSSPQGDVGFIGAMPVLVTPEPGAPDAQGPTRGHGAATFCPGTAAFTHTAQSKDTANSQFFLMRVRGPNLDGNFTAFGRVVDGQPVVDALNNGEPPAHPDKMTRVRVMADMPAAERPRLMVMDTRSPAFAALVRAALAAKGAAFTLCDVAVPTKGE
jgi:peptidylprolyl isomerase